MSNKIPNNISPNPEEEIHADLEKAIIDEYLKCRGYTMGSVNKLPKDEGHRIMVEASTYASGKLAEIESKARYTQNLKGTGRYEES